MRWFTHLLSPRAALARRFPPRALADIEAAIAASEARHRAEIRVAIEVALDLPALWRVRTARERALEVFAELGVWNTAESNGVLLYLLIAERDVEIVADTGFAGRVSAAEWQAVCQGMEHDFRAALWSAGVLRGIAAISTLAEREFPSRGVGRNEQGDRPVLL